VSTRQYRLAFVGLKYSFPSIWIVISGSAARAAANNVFRRAPTEIARRVVRFGVLSRRHLLVLALLASATLSCANLQNLLALGALSPPGITFQGANLVRSPSRRQLSAFYCPRVARSQGGLGFAGDLLCSQVFGAAPAPADMTLGFDLHFQVANPNQVPLPLSEVLTAITLFPGAAQQNLGAVCFRLCAPGDAACQAGRDPNACRDAKGDIHTLADFPQAVANMLLAEGVSAAGGGPVRFEAPRVLAGSSLDVVARFSLAPETVIPIFEQLARQSAGEFKAGRELSFSVPYNLQGTIFADGGSLGRVAAGFGPTGGQWNLPVQRLLP
jgi:hypothetical protein